MSRLLTWLEDAEIRGQIGPSYGRRAQSVRDLMLEDDYAQRALGDSRVAFEELRARAAVLHTAIDSMESEARGIALDWRWMFLWGSTGLLLRCLVVGVSWVSFAAVSLLAATAWVVTWRRPESVASVRQIWRVVRATVRAANAWPEYNKARRAWRTAMASAPVPDVLRQVARAAFVTESDLVLRAEDTAGLRAATDRSYVVPSRAEAELNRKMEQMDGGTIALCGPRGSGKTTLLDGTLERATLGVRTHTPTGYAPHDFLLSLFVDVCERYIVLRGYQAPSFRRLSRMRPRLSRLRLRPRQRRAARPVLFALLAGAFFALSMTLGAQDLVHEYGDRVDSELATTQDTATHLAWWLWGEERVVTAVAAALIGLVSWRLRSTKWVKPTVRLLWRGGWQGAGALLIVVAAGTVFTDPDITRLLDSLSSSPEGGLRHALVFWFLAWVFRGAEFKASTAVTVDRYTQAWRVLMKFGYQACHFGALMSLLADDVWRAMLLDDGNPGRLAMALCGWLVMGVPDLHMRPTAPSLVADCRDHLLSLRTVQTSSAGWNAGVPLAGASLSGQYGTSVSTIPSNFAELAHDFRALLARIARELRDQEGSFVIAVDELDRLGSDASALAFLNEIKAIFGVPYVHYIISVADDVGATFVRRGLPHRDATDSTLDDVVNVQPFLLEESQALLTRRVPGLTETHVLLVHALAGGIPRDLIRYGRRVVDLHLATGDNGLATVARRLIFEELAEVIIGFRVLLAKQPGTDESGVVLSAFRDLAVGLRNAPAPDLDDALKVFAFEGRVTPQHPGAPVPEPAGQLIMEASAFAYLSLTLLDVFANPDFPRRRSLAAARGYAGDPALLAEAKQELGVSAFSARVLITAIRIAWGLPVPDPDTNR
ncbi:P-loop NTPase fold protein [Streptomyces sp. CA-106110]|uniref:P-loop NTPase fold protein n=1 Tax=Streptomyces sp. CA-106110 TaxID=3240044 RepID=UPI003D8E829F